MFRVLRQKSSEMLHLFGKNLCGLDSKRLWADTSALCIWALVPKSHGYLRIIVCGGICDAGEEHIWGGLGGVSAGCWAGSLPQDGKARSCLMIKGQRLWFLNMPFWQTLHLLDEESVSFNVKHKWSLGNVLNGRTWRLKIICSKYSVCIYKQRGIANNSTAGWSSVIPESIYGSY